MLSTIIINIINNLKFQKMKKENKEQVFQAEVLEQRMEMAKWFVRTNAENPRVEVGADFIF